MIDIYNLNLDSEPLENLPDVVKQLRATAKAVNNLARYADAKRTAAEFRLAGKIQTSMQIEQFMESLYRELPDKLQW